MNQGVYAWSKYEQLAFLIDAAIHFYAALCNINPSLCMLFRKGKSCALIQYDMKIKHRRACLYTAFQTIRISCNQPHPNTFVSKYGQLIYGIIVKRRISVLIFFGQCHPSLYHLQLTPSQHLRIFKPFAMGYAFAGGHPVDFSRLDDLLHTKAISVGYRSAKQVAYRRQTDMWMRQNIKSARNRSFQFYRACMIHKNERAYHSALSKWKDAVHTQARTYKSLSGIYDDV